VHPDPKRPVYLNLLRIHLPIGGIVSIIHRVSGVLLVLLVPALVWLFDRASSGPRDYANVLDGLRTPLGRIAILLAAALAVQHLFSGIRHLLLDLEIGIERDAAARTAWGTLALSALALGLAGAWLW